MNKVVFGALGGRRSGNRDKKVFLIEDHPDFKDFDTGNPLRAFFGAEGVLAFVPNVAPVDALRHVRRAADGSCLNHRMAPGWER